jgi:hypothetical protein
MHIQISLLKKTDSPDENKSLGDSKALLPVLTRQEKLQKNKGNVTGGCIRNAILLKCFLIN